MLKAISTQANKVCGSNNWTHNFEPSKLCKCELLAKRDYLRFWLDRLIRYSGFIHGFSFYFLSDPPPWPWLFWTNISSLLDLPQRGWLFWSAFCLWSKGCKLWSVLWFSGLSWVYQLPPHTRAVNCCILHRFPIQSPLNYIWLLRIRRRWRMGQKPSVEQAKHVAVVAVPVAVT